ncbi:MULTISPECIES: hypothetical protein [unclassified Xanthomonas]|uniref:hypothetical protein n=1 Tax=unclassified Xanthomonas TaxID=2643310 RepID=UPI002B224BDE|nr:MULTISPECIES: hypothetical protein [unclassified Xanthomonas]MEA9562971.1 hypothetical protein [Xanthomonas sp. WHRI 8932A]MEA9634024.1 hypothetical protein [Xanthomonas sp. WHRI 8812E]
MSDTRYLRLPAALLPRARCALPAHAPHRRPLDLREAVMAVDRSQQHDLSVQRSAA